MLDDLKISPRFFCFLRWVSNFDFKQKWKKNKTNESSQGLHQHDAIVHGLAELRRKTRPFHHRFTSCLVCPETSVARDMLLIPGSSTWRFLLLREIFCYTKHSGTIQQWLETLIQNAKKLWMSKLKPFIKTEKKDATKSRQLKNQKYVFSHLSILGSQTASSIVEDLQYHTADLIHKDTKFIKTFFKQNMKYT